jgi:hypothetical protein
VAKTGRRGSEDGESEQGERNVICITAANVWKRRTVAFAISVLRLMRLMNAQGDVELRSPAWECRDCGKAREVLVAPEGVYGDCWSRKGIARGK